MKKETNKKPRLNIRIPKELYDWVFDYADSKHTTVTKILVDHISDLKKRETSVEQF